MLRLFLFWPLFLVCVILFCLTFLPAALLALLFFRGERRRRLVSRVLLAGAAFCLDLLVLGGGLSLRLNLPPVKIDSCLIVIGNQRSWLDLVTYAYVMRRLGIRHAEWVMLDKLTRIPIFGPLFAAVSIVVNRGSHRSDLLAIKAACASCAASGASVVIFPEGKAWSPARAAPGWSGLLPPKSGGFRLFCQGLPTYGILTIATIQRGWPVPFGSLVGLFGSTIKVECSFNQSCPTDPQAWLNAEWRRIESLLGGVK